MDDVCEGKDFSFPLQEQQVLSLWDQIDAFKTQLEVTKSNPEYIFYDGPPFATCLPHYGHILAGTIKDVVTRYQSMLGFHVTRLSKGLRSKLRKMKLSFPIMNICITFFLDDAMFFLYIYTLTYF